MTKLSEKPKGEVCK